MNFTKWLIFFISKYLNFYHCFFLKKKKTRTRAQIWILQNGWFVSSQNVWLLSLLFFWKRAHTYRYRCYKDGRFFIRIFCQNTHTRTDINFTQWMISFSFQNVRLSMPVFFFNAHTHRCGCYKQGRFLIRIFKKMAHTHRYELLQNGWFLSYQNVWIFIIALSENTYTRTDINVVKMADFSSGFWSKHAHTHRYQFYTMDVFFFHFKMSDFFVLGFFS